MCALPSPNSINKRIKELSLGVIDLKNEKYSAMRFAVAVCDCNLFIKPRKTKKLSENGFDTNCETLCRRGEIIILLSDKPKNGFYKVHSQNSFGYVKQENIGFISREKALDILNSPNFLCVTDKFIITNPDRDKTISKIPLSFGTRLIFTKYKSSVYTVKLPMRDKNGSAFFKDAKIPANTAVHRGYMKFSRKNILLLSLRMRGMPYDWGESFGGCDCSSLICSAFSICGIFLPRNSSKIGKITEKAFPVKNNNFKKCRPADIIVCKGHIMLYYGKVLGKHYVFHSFLGTKGITDITPINEKTSSGSTFLEIAEKIIPLKYI